MRLLLTLKIRIFSTTCKNFKRLKPFLDIMAPPANIYLTVIGSGRKGSPKSLLIDTCNIRYLVNCGESTQRTLLEYKSKASRIQHVYFTQMSWGNVSGLLGVGLTAKEAGVKKLTVHGPSKVEQLMRLTRNFADCETTDIVCSDILSKPFVDSAFHVQAFQVHKQSDTDEEPAAKRSKENSEKSPSSTVYAYYFKPFRSLRKLDRPKCIQLGIPLKVLESPAIRTILNGDNLVLDDGRVITPEEVSFPPVPPKNFLIIDCPDSEFIQSFQSHEQLLNAISEDSSNTQLTSGLALVVHFIPEGLFSSKKYQQFIKQLENLASTSCLELSHPIQHLVLDGTSSFPPTIGPYSQACVLNNLFDEVVYPVPYEINNPEILEIRNRIRFETVEPFSQTVYAEPQLQYAIRPWNGFIKPDYPHLDGNQFVTEVFDPFYMNREEAEMKFVEMRNNLKSNLAGYTQDQINKDKIHKLFDEEYPEVIFLGTASSSPNKYRNISGILIQLNPEDYIMLDCGEGTLNQLYSLYGPDKTGEILRKLKLILITHMHADHHGGVFSIALERFNLLKSDHSNRSIELLPILAAPQFSRWTISFNELFDYGPIVDLFILPYIYELNENNNFCWTLKCPNVDKANEWLKILNELNIRVKPVSVPHTRTSWAFIIEGFKSNILKCFNSSSERIDKEKLFSDRENLWSIVYSGDTSPCPELVAAGQNCDLLIHEATMVDEHLDLALRARHSTLGAAIKIGREMNASFILLNHFSQRYGRLAPTDMYHPNVAPTFDFMKIKFRDLVRLPFYTPYYKYAFAKHWSAFQVKSEAYKWRKLRESNTDQTATDNLEEKISSKLSHSSPNIQCLTKK